MVKGMKRSKLSVLDADFMEARAALLDVAAFLDRLDRAEGDGDFRAEAIRNVIPLLLHGGSQRTQAILKGLSYEGVEPHDQVLTKGACGAPKLLEK